VVLLDNVDYFFVNNNSNDDDDDDDDSANSRRLGNQHLIVRTEATFKEIMEFLRREPREPRLTTADVTTTRFPVLIFGTARRNVDDSASALFDRIFFLEPPTEMQRHDAIAQHLGICDSALGNINMLLTSLAQASIGKSYSELAQCCRQAIHQAAVLAEPLLPASREEESSDHQHQQPSSIAILHILQEQLHHKTPESLRSALVHDVVDMCVWTAQDFQSSSSNIGTSSASNSNTAGLAERTTEMGHFDLGLYGPSIEAAWKELQHSIVIPLCQRRALSGLLDRHGAASPPVLAGGLVLTGVPGTGKSAIAFETARFAARFLPSIKLLDVSCTSLIHKEVGGSERAIHQLFAAARRATPCILLMDGVDNIAAVRGNDATTEGTMDRVLSTLLVELDGVDDGNDDAADSNNNINQGMAVVGITHNVNWIDPALLRPGRLSKVVELQLPDNDTRQRIIQRELERIKTPFVIVDHEHVDDGVKQCDDNDETAETSTSTGVAAVTSLIVEATTGMAASSVMAICNDLRLWLARNTSNVGIINNNNDNNNEVDDGTDRVMIQIRRETIDSLIRSRR
jgi:SpoVK/Ycf46/Vps4 family AAA+-type ATPase